MGLLLIEKHRMNILRGQPWLLPKAEEAAASRGGISRIGFDLRVI
jgi:hypothetical protein